MRKPTVCLFILMALIALPALALDSVPSGIDVWWTPADGSTRADFQLQPIPADFFCPGSEPFRGSISFGGAPVATEPANILLGADTVIHRLDEAVFNERGVAQTRIQVRALNLESISPIQTRCGSFDVRASLYGEQPTTTMRIVSDGEGQGYYDAALSLDVRLVFTPLEGRQAPRELVHRVDLDSAPNSRWVADADRPRSAAGFLTVDTDGDNKPDTLVPGTTPGFFPSVSTPGNRASYSCHAASGHQHCYVCECCNLGPHEHCP